MKKHKVHKYRKVNIGRKEPYIVYRCMLPDCSHYLPESLIEGKKSICWRCGKEFVMTRAQMDPGITYKPVCCTKSEYRSRLVQKDSTVEDLIKRMSHG